jgi:recombinational DNA repair protein RecR
MVTTQLRFASESQRNKIKRIAKKNGRSMNAEIIIALDRHIEEDFATDAINKVLQPSSKQSNKK